MTEQQRRQRRRRLLHERAEAKARFNEGQRLDRHRAQILRDGRKWELWDFTKKQWDLLDKWDSGQLLAERNDAILALGHGRLQNALGQKLDIGGSTGGGCRRIVDEWLPEDPYVFLEGAQ